MPTKTNNTNTTVWAKKSVACVLRRAFNIASADPPLLVYDIDLDAPSRAELRTIAGAYKKWQHIHTRP